jgi:hypothetical protein
VTQLEEVVLSGNRERINFANQLRDERQEHKVRVNTLYSGYNHIKVRHNITMENNSRILKG